MNHPTPWKISYTHEIEDANDETVILGLRDVDCFYQSDEQVREGVLERIVACVNACRHLPTQYLEWLSQEKRFLVGTSLRQTGDSIAKFEQLVGQETFAKTASAANQAVQKLLDDQEAWRNQRKQER